MRQLKLLGFAILAILSLSIAVTGTAQAVELKFLPAKAKFSFKSKEAENTKLETLSGKKVECKSVSGTGEAVSERLGTVEFKFKECTGPLGVPCTGLGDTSGNITVKGEFHLRHLLEANAAFVNLSVLVSGVHFSCLGVLFTVNGCVTSDDLKTSGGANLVNTLVTSFPVTFLLTLVEVGGKKLTEPVVKTIDTDNSLGMENCVLLTKEGEAVAEPSAQLGTGTIEKCEPASCSFLVDLSGTQ